MTAHAHRRNPSLLVWLRATVIALATYGGLIGMQFSPGWGAALFSLAAAALSLLAADLGILLALVALTIPLAAANAIVGILFAVLAIVSVRSLSADGGSMFFLVAGAIAGSVFGPAWAIVPLAGYALGTGAGALAAGAACLALEALGVVLGGGSVLGQTVILGEGNPLASFDRAPASLFSPAWIGDSFGRIGSDTVNQVVDAIVTVQRPLLLLAQIALWASGAAVAGALSARARRASSAPLWGLAMTLGVLIPAGGVALLYTTTGEPTPANMLAVSALASLALAVAAVVLLERVFPFVKTVAAPVPVQMSSMTMEDADVDELLRLVATAEDKLASQHATDKVVMITDMKSFSKMTEEDGSILSAKSIQKHRDLLLPIIQQHGGHGKSTGGDGLVAAFDDAYQAVEAAAEMQRALAQYNTTHSGERELSVRLGIAAGEVVLDKGGRPFIGTALNIAARVMNLADGGQAFVTSGVAAASVGSAPTHSHGTYELKNISTPVEVVEILWGVDQAPRGPEHAGSLD
jgi:class 3 adenylate cyclase